MGARRAARRRAGRSRRDADRPADLYRRPKFFGMADPVPAPKRAFILPGSIDRVALELERHTAWAAVIERRVRVATAAAGRDWRKLLDSTLGSEAGFYAPLSQ